MDPEYPTRRNTAGSSLAATASGVDPGAVLQAGIVEEREAVGVDALALHGAHMPIDIGEVAHGGVW